MKLRDRMRRYPRSGGGEVAPPPSTFVATLAPASLDTRRRAFIGGHGGNTAAGAYLRIEATSGTNRYAYCSVDGYGFDPGPYTAELAGYEGVEVALTGPTVTAAARAAAYASALGAYYTTSSTGADLEITGAIAGVTVGGAFTARGTAGLFGNHTSAPNTNGNPFNAALAVHGTFTAGPALATAIGILLGTPAGDDVRIGLYTGGSSTSFVGTTLVAEGIVNATDDGSGNVYAWLPLTVAQALELADNTSVWLTAKCNTGGTTGIHPALALVGDSEDWTARNLVIFSGMSTDPAVAFPATLDGEASDIDTGFGVVMMAAIEYRTAPFVGDASIGGATTDGRIHGVHTAAVLGASQSNLLIPDAGGANVFAGFTTPPVIGKLLTRLELAIGDTHTSQFRVSCYAGGTLGDADGATLVADAGLTPDNAATNAWVGVDVVGEPALPDTGVVHVAFRGNGGVTIRYAPGAAPDGVNLPDDPADYSMTAADEFETNTSNPAHSTDPTDAFESPIVGDPDDFNPGNWPGVRFYWRLPGDSVVAA